MKKILLSLSLLCACAGKIDMSAAMSDQFLHKDVVQKGHAQEELEKVKAELKALGYSFQTKPEGQKMTTTLFNVVLLAPDFEENSPAGKVRTLRHELVHAKQWREYGITGFASKYSVEGQRWVLEMHGYRQDIRDRCDMGNSRASILKRIDRTSETFPASYKLVSLDHAKVKEATLFVLMEELDSYESCPDA